MGSASQHGYQDGWENEVPVQQSENVWFAEGTKICVVKIICFGHLHFESFCILTVFVTDADMLPFFSGAIILYFLKIPL